MCVFWRQRISIENAYLREYYVSPLLFIWMSLCSFCVFNLSSVLHFLQHSTWMALYRLLVLMYIKNLLTRSLGWRRVVYSVAGVSLTLWLLLVFCVQCFVEFCWSWSAQWTTHDHLQCTSCVWTREHSGISPARFLAKCRKRWLNLSSFCYILHCLLFSFYRAMLRRARYCYGKLSVCPSVRNVEVLWLHRLEIFKNNFMVS